MKQYRITSKDVWNEDDNFPDAILPEDDPIHEIRKSLEEMHRSIPKYFNIDGKNGD